MLLGNDYTSVDTFRWIIVIRENGAAGIQLLSRHSSSSAFEFVGNVWQCNTGIFYSLLNVCEHTSMHNKVYAYCSVVSAESEWSFIASLWFIVCPSEYISVVLLSTKIVLRLQSSGLLLLLRLESEHQFAPTRPEMSCFDRLFWFLVMLCVVIVQEFSLLLT